MGRSLLSNMSEANSNHLNLALTHIFLLFAWFLASMTIFFSFCLSRYRFRRHKHSSDAKNNIAAETTTAPPEPNSTNNEEAKSSWFGEDDYGAKPPVFQEEKDQAGGESSSHKPRGFSRISKTASKRLLSVSMSMKLPEKMKELPDRLSRIGTSVKREGKGKGKGKSDHGDPIWTKTIILGERCRVPGRGDDDNDDDDDDDDDEEDDLGAQATTSTYDDDDDDKANYRPRMPTSLPVSRSNSSLGLDQAAIDHIT